MTLKLGDVPPCPNPKFFAHFWIEATLANSGCWLIYNKVKMSTIGPMQASKLNKTLHISVNSEQIVTKLSEQELVKMSSRSLML